MEVCESIDSDALAANIEAQAIKEEGNVAYKSQDYEEALRCFSAAIDIDGTNATFFCNRSMCLGSLERWEESLVDAMTAVR